MLKRKSLFIIFLFVVVASQAQSKFPAEAGTIDSLLNKANYYKEQGDSVKTNEIVIAIDLKLTPIESNYPIYRGLIHLFQSYYVFGNVQSSSYQYKAIHLFRENKNTLADSFSNGFYNVMMLHYKSGKMGQWWVIDTLFRELVSGVKSNDGYRFGLLNYANKKLLQKQYEESKYLALYDYYCLMEHHSEDPMDKLSLMYLDWLITKGDLEQWMAMPYVKKYPEEYKQSGQIYITFLNDISNEAILRKIDFATIFKTLISRVKELKEVAVLQNKYGTPEFNPELRTAYYNIYTAIINGFCNWAISEQKEGQALLSLKVYLYQDIIPNEMEAAAQFKVRPIINAADIVSLFQSLCILYDRMGNGDDEIAAVDDALDLVDIDYYSIDEKILGMVNLFTLRSSAYRLQGNYEKSLRDIAFLKKYATLPTNASSDNDLRWERYMSLHIEEVYTLMAMQRNDEAKDSLIKLMDDLAPLDSADIIYKTDHWPHLQYITVIFSAWQGKWNTPFLIECMHDLENNPTALQIFYPVQLLCFNSTLRSDNKVSESLLTNLLFYTGRQIRYTFMMLSAEDRMRLYEQKLRPYFDVYHELLFAKKLDSFPELKEKIIAQSLSIKNALADGNLISNELLLKNGNTLEYLEGIRELRQEVNMILLRERIGNRQTKEEKKLQDQVQSLWLRTLDQSGMDSLVQLTKWQNISAKLKPNEVYTETIRYTKSLTDSTAHYGAYIILPGGKMEVISLYDEKSIDSILRNPYSSPQNIALNINEDRGSVLIDENEKPLNKYNVDSTDKLAQLLLKPFLPYIKNKKDWYLVQDGLLNRISFAALKYKSLYLFEEVQLHLLTASNSLMQQKNSLPVGANALLAGGLDYGVINKGNKSRLFREKYSWNYLPGTNAEIKALEPLFTKAGTKVNILTGKQFPDSLINILKEYQLIHLATHGFYLDSISANKKYEGRWSRTAMKDEPLFRCGIVLSDANNPDSSRHKETEGYLLGYELSNIDLRQCYLISLSACETGLGDLRNNLGVDGLSRALKIAGAKYLLISLWQVPDQATAVFMKNFYENLFTGKNPEQALRATQTLMSKTYPVTDWAAFVLIN